MCQYCGQSYWNTGVHGYGICVPRVAGTAGGSSVQLRQTCPRCGQLLDELGFHPSGACVSWSEVPLTEDDVRRIVREELAPINELLRHVKFETLA